MNGGGWEQLSFFILDTLCGRVRRTTVATKTRAVGERGNRTTPLYVGSRVAGHVTGEVLRKAVNGSKHFLRKPPAIAFNVDVLSAAEHLGAKRIVVTDLDTKHEYACTVETFRAHAIKIERWDGQLALTMAYWGVDGKLSPHEGKLAREAEEAAKKEAIAKMQLTLFEL